MEPKDCQHDIWINGEYCSGCGISSRTFAQAMIYATRSSTTILTYLGDREFAVVVYSPPGEPHPSPADLEAIHEQITVVIGEGGQR